jgi:hypothetical protein
MEGEMQRETAHILLQTIADIQTLTFDAQHKILALERTIKEREPDFYARYQKELEAVRTQSPFEVNPAGFGALLDRLVEDR